MAAIDTSSPQQLQFRHPATIERNVKASLSPSTAMRTPMIEPAFWAGDNAVPAERFTIDCQNMGLAECKEPPAELIVRMKEVFNEWSLVLLTNTGLPNLDLQKMYASVLIPRTAEEYKAGANSRGQTTTKNVFDTGAPKEAHLHYHHEMVYSGKSTPRIGFLCDRATAGKGATFVSDGQMTTNMLMQTELGKKLKEKGVCYIRCLTDRDSGEDDDPSNDQSGVYNHWQTSFGTESVEEVERLAAERGMEVEWGGSNGRFLKTKYYTSAFEYSPLDDRNLLYSSVADDSVWFDTWPGVRKLPTMDSFGQADESMRPLKMLFGDDSEFSREEIELFVRVYDAAGVQVQWKEGDCLMLCNRRWAHGRPRYSLAEGEQRHLGVVLGEFFDRVGPREDKW